ncbi:carboxypeptidase Y-deficient [Diatrype stigma]|uniref:Carboxypeptidase Y-deficient n=1 Tax=Diatrype stigma TaxID=117547 RepID=A0AAN9UH89_9PEZI
MSSRKLGGGRILGSGKGLAPPTPPAIQLSASPSDSTLSIGSPDASISGGTPSPLPGFTQDLTSAVSIGTGGGPSNGGPAGSRLVCPICEEEMLTLLQLNRHIDDNHQELPEVEQDEVKTWFDKQVLKAKKFQPLSIINQKLRGLDVFESNESLPPPPTPTLVQPTTRSSPLPELPFDPDDVITRSHWQRSGIHDLCTDPACGKRLGAVNGSVNCRKCGRLFCEEHTMYQMKLSRSATPEPVRGYWYRVCETCYKSREGYNDHNGLLRDHTKDFISIRQRRVERQALEISRLETRLTRLTQLLVNPPEDILAAYGGGIGVGVGVGLGSGGGSLLAPVSTQRNQRKAIEQLVVTWEEDAKVSRCPFCQQDFGSWTFRRHHCRICGRVVCADPQTACSSEVGLSVANPGALPTTEKLLQVDAGRGHGHGHGHENGNGHQSVSLDIRMCRDCRTTIFSKRDFVNSVSYKPPDQRAYETLRQFERGIQQLLPNFQRALIPLQRDDESSSSNPPSHAQIQNAAKLRKRLTDSFTKYDTAARRLRDLKTDSPTQKMLQKAIYAAASSFLHMHMLPLKNLPRMLKQNSSSGGGSSKGRLLLAPNGHPVASPLRNGIMTTTTAAADAEETASQATNDAASEASTAVSALETEEKELRERLVVLEEQRYLVQGMISNAHGARRFEEVSALSRNVEELDGEIADVRARVAEVEDRWRGVYA